MKSIDLTRADLQSPSPGVRCAKGDRDIQVPLMGETVEDAIWPCGVKGLVGSQDFRNRPHCGHRDPLPLATALRQRRPEAFFPSCQSRSWPIEKADPIMHTRWTRILP